MISNKKKGSGFEEEFAKMLSDKGFWAHIVAPSPKDGSQPFDIVAAKNGYFYAFDCKTIKGTKFPLVRIEENQEKAFKRLWYTNSNRTLFAFKLENGEVRLTDAMYLIEEKKRGVKSIYPGEVSFNDWVKHQ